ncbi:MAG: SLC13 family permease [Desulfobacteraceae bacterium]|nr:MAG: SLC13 family permease [Desulfobacteraceae bacterium]
MTPQIALIFIIVAAALIFFSTEWVSPDVVGLGVLLSLILAGLLPPEKAFSGFGSEAVVMIFALFVLTAALSRTGVIDMVGRLILRHMGEDESRLLIIVMATTALLSTFISNTASTAFFLPLVLGISERLRVSASRFLMPLAFSAVLASSVTLISTSTNIVISGLLVQYKMDPIGMFEITPVGLPIMIAGLAYMVLLGRRLMPVRGHPDDLIADFGKRLYLTELVILPGSPLIGKTLAESGLGRDLDLTILWLVRGKERHRYLVPKAQEVLETGDELLVEGKREEILKIKEKTGIDIKADHQLSDAEFKIEDLSLVEAVILPRSSLLGKTLKQARFRHRYGVQVLALYRHGESLFRRISEIPLRVGDVLLLQGHRSRIGRISGMERDNLLHVLGSLPLEPPNMRRAPVAVFIFAGALAAAAFNLVSLPVSLLLGVFTAFLTGCISPARAYRDVEWRVLILIGSMLGLGAAMDHTGAAQFLATGIVAWAGDARPTWLLTGFFFLAVLLTQPMSNQAAAIVVVPVAIQTALHLGLNPRTFAMIIAVAASTSYITPLEPACLMVYGPGGYRFTDFLKVGSLMTLIVYAISILLVPVIWPLS